MITAQIVSTHEPERKSFAGWWVVQKEPDEDGFQPLFPEREREWAIENAARFVSKKVRCRVVYIPSESEAAKDAAWRKMAEAAILWAEADPGIDAMNTAMVYRSARAAWEALP